MADSASLSSDQELDFYGLTREKLAESLLERCEAPPYRATQIFEWVYKKEVADFAAMTNISKVLREKMAQSIKFPQPRMLQRRVSSDGTRKYLFEVEEGVSVESVMIAQPGRRTLCVSSQMGCAMGCTFCRTATMGLLENLTTGGIVRQVMGVSADSRSFGDTFQNIVFMGMGEPLHNLDNVADAVRILKDVHGLGIAPRKITLSTSGLVPGIRKLAELGLNVNLAVSLNAATDELRSKLMPINRAYPLSMLLAALRDFPLKPRGRITIEYIVLAGVNDSHADMQALAELLKGLRVKINLIPYNENAGLAYHAPTDEQVTACQEQLRQCGFLANVRWSKGADIEGACGQLALK